MQAAADRPAPEPLPNGAAASGQQAAAGGMAINSQRPTASGQRPVTSDQQAAAGGMAINSQRSAASGQWSAVTPFTKVASIVGSTHKCGLSPRPWPQPRTKVSPPVPRPTATPSQSADRTAPPARVCTTHASLMAQHSTQQQYCVDLV